MISKTVKDLLTEVNVTLTQSVHNITHTHIAVDDANQSLKLSVNSNDSSVITTPVKTDPYHYIPTSFITLDNFTQPTMTRNIVSAFTVNGDDAGDAFDKPHHTTMVAVLLGIFTCISITMTVSVFVFCRKKNSVFMLQKCEQDSDIDLEMNDMNTEVETSDSEYEFIESSSPQHETRRSQTCPNLSKYGENNDDSCKPLYSEKYHRRSLKLGKNLSGSPTSTPLLNSTPHTTVHLSISDRQFSDSLSSNSAKSIGATAAMTSGMRYNHTNKNKHDTVEKSKSSESDSFLNKGKHYKHSKQRKNKYSSVKNTDDKPVRKLEYETVEIHADSKGARKILCVEKPYEQARNCNELNTSILKMESIENDSEYISDVEVQILDHFDGKLEILS